jgi:hypothetical protein
MFINRPPKREPQMTITNEQWDGWLHVLEDMLHDADVGQASMFAIHINSAIEQIHRERGTARVIVTPDYLPSDDKAS